MTAVVRNRNEARGCSCPKVHAPSHPLRQELLPSCISVGQRVGDTLDVPLRLQMYGADNAKPARPPALHLEELQILSKACTEF